MGSILKERLKNSQVQSIQQDPIEQEKNGALHDIPNNMEKYDDSLSEEDLEQLNALDEMMAEENFAVENRRKKFFQRLSTGILILACTYLIILIYGSFITEFYYDDKGKLAPVIMTVSDISEKNEYNSIVGMYIQTRQLYEILLSLDYRMAAGAEDTLSIAPEYEKTLDIVSSLTTQIDAAVIDSKYNQVRNMLLTWVKTHAAAYCQYMSTAISQNDSNAASEAIAARQVLNSNFQLITQNVITLGQDIKGYDLDELKNWSPDGYIQETMEGIKPEDQQKESESKTELFSEDDTIQNSSSELQQETSDSINKDFVSDFSLR